MSLELAAKHMAAQGRGPDTMLVHMAPKEVAGLQALAMAHGGSLTLNPKTGLPEAGFLSSLLPTILGAGLAMTGIGAPMAALLVGGGYGLASGSLMKGLTAGLGAFGGAGLAGSIGSIGTQAGVTAGASEAAAAGQNAAANAVNAVDSGVAGATYANPATVAYERQLAAGFTPEQIMADQADYATNMAGTKALANPMQTGLGAIMDKPSVLADQMGGWGNVAKTSAAAFGPAVMAAMQPTSTGMPDLSDPNPYKYRYEAGSANPTPMPDAEGREQQYYAPSFVRLDPETGEEMKRGGLTMAGGGTTQMPDPEGRERRYRTASMPSAASAATLAKTSKPQHGGIRGLFAAAIERQGGSSSAPAYRYDPAKQQMVLTRAANDTSGIDLPSAAPSSAAAFQFTGMAAGGLSDLGGYSDGGRLLRGPGDGVSDSIPATIGQKQPARLADGEFVVPARIVSEIGNGSTEAGARKLYAMMDRVQAARRKTVGKGKVAVNSRADKLLPA